jgi:hypothetical protein
VRITNSLSSILEICFKRRYQTVLAFLFETPWIFSYAAAWQNIQHEFSLGSGDASCLSSLEAIGLRVRRGRSGMVSQPSSPLSGQNSSPTRLQKMSVIKPLSQRVNMVTFRRFSHDCVSLAGPKDDQRTSITAPHNLPPR